MDMIDAMDVQSWITFIHNRTVFEIVLSALVDIWQKYAINKII